ncbi:MAG TPA: YraN family protein [Chitinophagaceae bacterium]|nr:YraN family protein [Chitinophagaceae bacterium]
MSNKYTGDKGEEMAAAYLTKNGYNIVERNWRFKHWEVDIIASKGNCMHFFEIKTRSSDMYGHPEESVSKKKMVNLRNAAEEYQYLYPEWKYVQFNVLAIKMFYNQPVEIMLFEDVYF